MTKTSETSIVYYASARATKWDYKYSLIAKLEELIERLDFSQHIEPDDYVALCTLCLQCYHVCPTGAVLFDDADISFDEDECWRCGRCARVCPEEAITKGRELTEFQRGLAEVAQAVLSTFAPGKVLYFNFVLEVQPECDCMPVADTPLVQDQGILASTDIVAIEQASYDLINRAVPLPGSLAADKELRQGDCILADAVGIDAQEQIDAAAELGLGSKVYELVEVESKG